MSEADILAQWRAELDLLAQADVEAWWRLADDAVLAGHFQRADISAILVGELR